jgi:hypothetical protein
MRKALVVLVVLGLTLVARAPAGALTITQTQSFSATTFDAIGVTPFDPTLGTLDSIGVRILGMLNVIGVTGLNVVPGPVPQPVGYDFRVSVDQRFFGLAGRYFEFLDPAQFLFSGSASGAGEGFAFATLYQYDFAFTALTDLIGFTLPSVSTTTGVLVPPLSGIGGQRGDFVESLVPIDEIDLVQLGTVTDLAAPSSPTLITLLSTAGTLQISYDYTPAPVPVPGPATLTLFAAFAGATGGLALGRRRPQCLRAWLKRSPSVMPKPPLFRALDR